MPRTDPRGPGQPVTTVRYTRSTAFQWLVASVAGVFGFAYAFGHVLAAIRGTSLEPIVVSPVAPPEILLWLAVSLGLVALVVIPHELLHGAFMLRYGGDPSYGIGVSRFVLPYAYAETGDTSYTRNQMLVIALAPFTVITTVGLAAMVVYPSPLLLVPLSANAAGSVGDLWMAGVLLQYPADVHVAELPGREGRGFGVYASSDREVGPRAGAAVMSTAVSGAVGTLAILVTGFVGAVLLSLSVGSGTVAVGDPDGRWFLFRHTLTAGGEAHLEIGAFSLLVVAVVGGFLSVIVHAGVRVFRVA